MSVSAFARRLPFGTAPSGGLLPWLVLTACAGLGVGAAAAASVRTGIAMAVAIGLLSWVVARPPIILIALVTSVFIQVLSVGGVTVARVLTPMVLLVVALGYLRGTAVLRYASPLAWATGYALWALASGLWTTHVTTTENQLASLAIALVYMLGFATLTRTSRDVDRVLYTFAVVAVAVGFYGMVSSQGRAGTDTGDANFFALIEIIALPLVLALAADLATRARRLLTFGAVLVIIAAIFSSLSRGGLIALGAVVVCIVVLPSRRLFASPGQKLAVMLVLAVAVAGAYQLTAQALTQRVDAVFTSQGRTGSGRLNAWRAASTSIHEHPVLGLGYGSFERSANELMLRTPGVDLSNFRLRPNGLEAHSAYIGTLADLGIPGLALFLGLLGSTALTLRRFARQAEQVGAARTARLARALVISFIGWAVASIFLSSETSRPPWIVIGLCLALPALMASETTDRGIVGHDREVMPSFR